MPWIPSFSRQYVGAFAVALLTLALAALVAPTSGWAAGELTQKAGVAGCVTFDGSEECTTAPQVGRMAVISPDGKFIYTEAWEPRAAIQIFERDPATGVVTPKPGPTGCWQNNGAGGACEVLGLTKPSGIAMDPDGENLYVSDFHTGTLITFDRDTTTGLLTPKPGIEGCMSNNGNGVTCALSPAQTLSFHILVSPDGKNVYTHSAQSGGSIMTYDRNPATGVLTVPTPSDGSCITNDGGEGGGFGPATCLDGRGLQTPEAIGIDPDGENVYTGSREGAVTVFDRDPVTGKLTQKAGVAGCWRGTGWAPQADCQEGVFIDNGGGRFGLDVAPDGKNVYVATGASVAVFNRNTETGVLSQPAEESAACVSSFGAPCFPAPDGMDEPQDVAVSPDGLQVYVATASGSFNSGVAVFDRDPATGQLTQKLGKDGCHTKSGNGGQCTVARAVPTSTVLASPDGKNVYANSGGGAMAIFDRTEPPPPGPGPEEGPGPGGAGSTGGIGTQGATASAPGPATGGGRAQVGVQIVGRPQAGHYPYTASLLLTNYGTKPAVNATARIDGFHTGGPVTVLGGGATGMVLDDGASRSLLISVEQIPARSSKAVLARFTPVGPGHSFYNLHASLMRNTAPGGVPKLTETRSVVTRAVTSGAGTGSESGTVTVTNSAGTATIPYKLEQTASGPARAETKFKEAGGGVSVTVTAPQYATATAPPKGGKTKRQGGVRLELSIDAAGLKVLGVDNPVWPMAGGIKLQYDELIDCMQRHGMLTAADQKRLKAMFTHQVLALIHTGRLLQSSSVPPSPEADAWAEQTISVAASAVKAWEAEIIDSAKLDPAGGGKDKQKHIFIECSREERKDDGSKEKKEEETDKSNTKEDDLEIEVITPDDPNAKYGPHGAGKAGYIPPNQLMPYTIMFENKPTASAPAREVVVTDQLDGSKLDLPTFALGPVWFGDKVLSPPPGLRAWSGSIDLRPAKPVIVTVDANIDANGLATWHFKTIDPLTQVFPEDPFAGFLPANNPPPIGEGAVTFTVAQKRKLKTGSKISNAARIVFDKNEAIDTPVFTNTIDGTKPKVALRKAKVLGASKGKGKRKRKGKRFLARKSGKACRVALSWKGTDKGSGVGSYTVWVAARKKGKFQAVKRDYKRTRFTYKGKPGVLYRFSVVPADRAGNIGKGSKSLKASCPRP